jgi:hypothetical protein
MLIYIILMLALAYFFQKEGQKLLAGKSKLLAEFCQDAYATKTALSTADSLSVLCCQRLLDADCLPAFQNHP